MTIAGELINILGFRLEGKENLKKFGDGMDQAEDKSKVFAGRIKGLAAAAGLSTGAMIAFGSSAVKNFAGFERAMSRIGITAGASIDETVQAADQLQTLSKKFALPIEEAVSGLDTLVASGMSLEQAMSFLPSVLATAQASGAAVTDVANTAQKVASALKLSADQMDMAFDVMVAGGKAGQFELKDMAQYIPTLANSFANLGYDGEEGLKKLIAMLQTLREDTGSASQAATQAQNIFTKMFSQETEKNFSEFGVDIRKEVDAAVKAGEGAVDAYVRISRRVMEENPTAKLVDLFADQEFQLGMQSLMTSADSLQKFLDILNGSEVEGTVLKDVNRVINDTEAAIQNLSTSWDGFMKAVGSGLSGPVSTVLNAATDSLTKGEAIKRGAGKRGMSSSEREIALFLNGFDPEYSDRLAREGGYVPLGDTAAAEAQRSTPRSYEVLGRRPNRPTSRTPVTVADDTPQMPVNVFAGFEAKLDGMNANLAKMTGSAGAEAVITDARTDARNQSVTVQVGGVTVQGVQNVSGAVGGAVGNAVGQSAARSASRFEKDDAF